MTTSLPTPTAEASSEWSNNHNNNNQSCLSSFVDEMEEALDEEDRVDNDNKPASSKATRRRSASGTTSVLSKGSGGVSVLSKRSAAQATTTTTTTSSSGSHHSRGGRLYDEEQAQVQAATTAAAVSSREQETPAGFVLISKRRLLCWQLWATLGSLLAAAALAVGLTALVQTNETSGVATQVLDSNNNATQPEFVSLLDQIRQRGHVNCGVVAVQPGFLFETTATSSGSTSDEQGPNYVGFDVDYCRALAAAIFDGNADAYRLHLFKWGDRWTQLNSSQVDLVFRSTYTMDRDVYLPEIDQGVEFSSPYFYDGMVFAGVDEFVDCAEQQTTNGTCADLKVCFIVDTTFETAVRELFPDDPDLLVGVSEVFINDFPNRCNVMAADRIAVSELTLRQQGYTGNYRVGTQLFTKEPYCFVTPQFDRRWTDFVEFVLQALIYAEANAITQVRAAEMPATLVFGQDFEQMFQHAVAAGGHYGELYVRNLENFSPRSGLNLLNGEGVISAAMLWSFPFGNLDVVGPALEDVSPTAKAILDRGFLRCAKADYNFLASFDAVSQMHVGFDADLCRAISAALFDGVTDRLLFVETDYPGRWNLLNSGKVDLIGFASTWTLSRDVREPTSQRGYTFTDPYFYFWQSFAGLEAFVECADNRDVVSPQCQDLRICTYGNTPYYGLVTEHIGNDFYIVGFDSYEEIVAGLRNKQCNVIYESMVQVEERTVRASGYGDELPYVVGKGIYDVSPTSFITSEDDPVWSDFVRWILRAIVYAEEEGITQATADLMPRPGAFGPLYTNALYYAVNAVGNYEEIYLRNDAPQPRRGQNRLNDNTEARIFATGGFETSR